MLREGQARPDQLATMLLRPFGESVLECTLRNIARAHDAWAIDSDWHDAIGEFTAELWIVPHRNEQTGHRNRRHAGRTENSVGPLAGRDHLC